MLSLSAAAVLFGFYEAGEREEAAVSFIEVHNKFTSCLFLPHNAT